MYVANKEEQTKDVTVEGSDSTVFQIQHDWDKQANFLHAQARAMQTLNNMIKQYDDFMKSELAIEKQKARITNTSVELVD